MQKKEQEGYFAHQGNNIFVTKKIFFVTEHRKNFFTHKFLVDPVGWRQTNIFLGLAKAAYFLWK